MHAFSLGIDLKHFVALIDILCAKKDKDSVYQKISIEFSQYCRENSISAFCNFSNEKTFLMNMTAGSVKEFVQASIYIVLKLRLLPTVYAADKKATVDKKRFQENAFDFWCWSCKNIGNI